MEERLHQGFVHPDRARGDTRAGIWQVRYFKETLKRAVFAVGAVYEREDDVAAGECAECLGRFER